MSLSRTFPLMIAIYTINSHLSPLSSMTFFCSTLLMAIFFLLDAIDGICMIGPKMQILPSSECEMVPILQLDCWKIYLKPTIILATLTIRSMNLTPIQPKILFLTSKIPGWLSMKTFFRDVCILTQWVWTIFGTLLQFKRCQMAHSISEKLIINRWKSM
jgi:hypothetical protein